MDSQRKRKSLFDRRRNWNTSNVTARKRVKLRKTDHIRIPDELFLMDEFKQQGRVYVATEDGSAGTEGNVLDAIRENGLDAEIIMPADQCRCSVP